MKTLTVVLLLLTVMFFAPVQVKAAGLSPELIAAIIDACDTVCSDFFPERQMLLDPNDLFYVGCMATCIPAGIAYYTLIANTYVPKSLQDNPFFKPPCVTRAEALLASRPVWSMRVKKA